MNQPITATEGQGRIERALHSAFVGSDSRLRAVWRFLFGVAVAILANVAAGFFASALGRGRVFELFYRPLALVFVLAGFAVLLKLVDDVEGKALAAMGLSLRKPWLRDAVKGSALGFFMVFVAYVILHLTCEWTSYIFLNGRAGKLFVAELVILAAAAMLEEAMFRGYPFQRLIDVFEGAGRFLESKGARFWGPERVRTYAAGAAAVVWSLAFGAAHLRNPSATFWSFLNTSLVGILFCVVYLRTRSLWMPWGIHFAWNMTLGTVFGLPVSGIRQFSTVVRSYVKGPAWITGGNYGIEGSALGTLAIVVGLVLVLVFVKQRQVAAADGNGEATLVESSPAGIQP
jgi:CAAX protease family protein